MPGPLVIPLAIAALAAVGLTWGCDKKSSKSKPNPSDCMPEKYAKHYNKNPRLTNTQAERLCGIKTTTNTSDLEKKYFDCSKQLLKIGNHQPALGILMSLRGLGRSPLNAEAEKIIYEFWDENKAKGVEIFLRPEWCYYWHLDEATGFYHTLSNPNIRFSEFMNSKKFYDRLSDVEKKEGDSINFDVSSEEFFQKVYSFGELLEKNGKTPQAKEIYQRLENLEFKVPEEIRQKAAERIEALQ